MEMNFRPQLNPAEDEAQLKQTEQEESPAVESQESEINIEVKRQELYRDFQVALEAYNKEKEASGSESGQWGRTNDENLRNTSQAAAECLDILKKLIDTSENTKYLVIEKNSDGSFSIENSDIPIEVHMDGETGIVNGFTIQGQRHEVNAGTHKARKNLNTNQLTVFRFIYSPEVTVKPPAEVIGEPASMPSEQSNYLGENGKNTADFILGHIDTVNSRNPEIEDDLEVEANQDNEKVEQKFQVIQELIEKRTEYTALEDIEDDVDKAGKDQIQERKQQILQEMQSLGGANGILNLDIELFDVFDNQIQRNLERVGEAFSESDGEIAQIQERLRQIDIAEAQEGFAYYKEYYFKQLQESFDAQSQLDSAKAEAELNSRLEREARIRPLIETAIDIIPIVIKLQTLKELQANSQNPSSYDVNIAITQMQLGEMLSKVKKAEKAMDLETILAEMDNQGARDAEMSELMNADDISSVLITLIDSVVDKKDKLLGVEKGEIQTAEKEARASIESTKEELRLPERSEDERQFEEKAGQVRQHLSAIYRNQLLSEVYAETLKTIQENQDRFEEEHLTDLKNIYQQEVETAQRAVDVAYKNLVDLNIVDSSEIANKEKFIDYVPDMPLSIVREFMNSIEPAGDIENQIGYFEMTMSIVDDERGRVQNEIRQAIEKVLRVESSESEGSSAIVLANKVEEVGEDVIVVLDEEETFTQDSEDLDKINQEISTLEAEIQRLKDEEEKVDQSKKEGIKAEYKKLEKQLLEKKREKVRIENAEYINRKLEDLQALKERLDAVRNGETLDESRTDLPSDLESLQVLYQKEFTKTVNILAGLHMREEMKNLYKSQFDHMIKEYNEAEAAEESKVVTGFKALAKKWKSIPAKYKIGIGLSLGVVSGGVGAAAVVAGGGLLGMKALTVTSTWVGMDSWTQKKLENGRIDEVKAKIKSLKENNSDARSVVELMALATTTRELTGKEVLSQDELNEILELSAEKFTQKAESDVKIDDEKRLAKLKEKINNQEDAPTGGVNIEGQHVYTEISAVADYKQEQQERLNKNKREKFINRYVKSGGVALGVAFSGEILRGSFEGAQAMFDSAENGIESAVDSVPDLNFEGAPSDGGDVGFTDFDGNVNTQATSPSFESGAVGNAPEAIQVGEVFDGNTYASRFGDIEVGRISEVLSERFPNDVISFDSGDTVSGELKTLLANHLGVEPDADMLAEASYAFLTTHEGKLQLYELVSATETGQEALNHMGYTSLETFMDASPDFEEIMDLSEHMGTGELVGLNTFVEDMEAESIFGINEVQDYTSPFDNVDGVKISDRGVITEIDYHKAGITPEQISTNINNLGDNVEVVFSGSSPQISDRFRFIMSEALGVTWDKVDYKAAAPVMQEYFFHSDVGSQWVYDTVMSNAENPDLQVIKGYLESFAESQNMSLQDLGSEENKHLIKSALAGPNQGQYGTRLTAILAGVSRSVEPGQALQIPNLRSEITRILTNKVTT